MATQNPPNILWISTDQQRWDTLGCYGNDLVLTPNIDRLAAQGFLFEKAFCQSPICTPSQCLVPHRTLSTHRRDVDRMGRRYRQTSAW